MKGTINQRIAHYRKLAGYTQAEAAELIGIKSSTYSQRERKGNVDYQFLIDASVLFKVDLKELIFGDEEPRTSFGNGGDPPLNLTVGDKQLIKIVHTLDPNGKKAVTEYAYNLFKSQK